MSTAELLANGLSNKIIMHDITFKVCFDPEVSPRRCQALVRGYITLRVSEARILGGYLADRNG